jgi:hypothetical protein
LQSRFIDISEDVLHMYQIISEVNAKEKAEVKVYGSQY